MSQIDRDEDNFLKLAQHFGIPLPYVSQIVRYFQLARLSEDLVYGPARNLDHFTFRLELKRRLDSILNNNVEEINVETKHGQEG